jgi:hypothetical protein
LDLIDAVAPGLRSLPDAFGNASHVLDNPSVGSLLPLVVLVCIAYLAGCYTFRWLRYSFFPTPGESGETWRPSNTPFLSRLWWKVKPPNDLMVIDGVQINRDRKPHCLWLGPTGAGKSQSVATVRCDGKRPMLIVTPDLSDPLRERADFIWTACVSEPVDFLIGSPTSVAEMLTEVFPSGGTGAWKMAARRATVGVIEYLDLTDEPRSLQRIGELLKEVVAGDPALKRATETWVERFLSTALQFGPSISSDGVDISILLRQGKTVVLDNDSWKHPGLVGDIVALGLAEARRCADLVPGGFRLVFEEAGQLDDRIALADPFFRAGRRRFISVDALSQAESDMNEAILSNSATRIYFAPETGKLQKLAADRLKIHEDKLDPGWMPDFSAWLSHGKVRKLVKFPKPKKAKSKAFSRLEIVSDEIVEKDFENVRARYVIERVREELPMLPPPGRTIPQIEEHLYRDGECERWNGNLDRNGYARVYLEGRLESVHRLRWEMAYGPIGRNADGTKLTVDHIAGICFHRDCSRLTHLRLLTRSENSKARWAANATSQRRKIDKSAG